MEHKSSIFSHNFTRTINLCANYFFIGLKMIHLCLSCFTEATAIILCGEERETGRKNKKHSQPGYLGLKTENSFTKRSLTCQTTFIMVKLMRAPPIVESINEVELFQLAVMTSIDTVSDSTQGTRQKELWYLVNCEAVASDRIGFIWNLPPSFRTPSSLSFR